MTPEEAIKSMQNLKLVLCITDSERNSVNTAIVALEKQIPEEPELEADGYDDDGNLIYEYGYCPDCRHEFEIAYDSPDYCPDCGKHLKWPDWVE